MNKNRIITSSPPVPRNRLLSFFLSLIAPGAGELYRGMGSRSLFYLLVRPLAVLMVTVTVVIQPENTLYAATVSALLVLFTWIVSPVSSLARIAPVRPKWYNRFTVYLLYILASTLLLALSLGVTLHYLDLLVAPGGSEPSVKETEVILVMRNTRTPSSGKLVVYGQGNIGRICAMEGEKVTLDENGITMDRFQLAWKKVPDTLLDQRYHEYRDEIMIEKVESCSYAVLGTPSKNVTITVPEKQVLMVKDDRRKDDIYELVPLDSIKGVVAGVVVPARWYRFLLVPYL